MRTLYQGSRHSMTPTGYQRACGFLGHRYFPRSSHHRSRGVGGGVGHGAFDGNISNEPRCNLELRTSNLEPQTPNLEPHGRMRCVPTGLFVYWWSWPECLRFKFDSDGHAEFWLCIKSCLKRKDACDASLRDCLFIVDHGHNVSVSNLIRMAMRDFDCVSNRVWNERTHAMRPYRIVCLLLIMATMSPFQIWFGWPCGILIVYQIVFETKSLKS